MSPGHSSDILNDYELVPASSFHPSLIERRRFYYLCQPNGSNDVVSFANEVNQSDAEENFGAFMQGVNEDSTIFHLTPLQIGVFLTFAPPMKGYVLHHNTLLMLRRSFRVIFEN